MRDLKLMLFFEVLPDQSLVDLAVFFSQCQFVVGNFIGYLKVAHPAFKFFEMIGDKPDGFKFMPEKGAPQPSF